MRTRSRPRASTWWTYVVPSPVAVSAGVEVTEPGAPGSRASRPASRDSAYVVPRRPTATSSVRPAPSGPSTGATCVAHEPARPIRSGLLQPECCVRRRTWSVPADEVVATSGRPVRDSAIAGLAVGAEAAIRRSTSLPLRGVPARTRPSRVVAASHGRP
ncbi:hypothetical protein EUA06_08140 [Nocardioides glacieisoli]|uniref:Uncharacterized protein n=1 Tax=Nocardioides glacieisoli TaxID=1168730 RepID=A0A4V1RK74_9ACTN|nr:hypothetical protein EUA06_08140 [Nocardioides glacieisoli]